MYYNLKYIYILTVSIIFIPSLMKKIRLFSFWKSMTHVNVALICCTQISYGTDLIQVPILMKHEAKILTYTFLRKGWGGEIHIILHIQYQNVEK